MTNTRTATLRSPIRAKRQCGADEEKVALRDGLPRFKNTKDGNALFLWDDLEAIATNYNGSAYQSSCVTSSAPEKSCNAAGRATRRTLGDVVRQLKGYKESRNANNASWSD